MGYALSPCFALFRSYRPFNPNPQQRLQEIQFAPSSYSVNEEVTLKGTISSVVTKPTHGMIMGGHLMVNTSTGTVDASLGTLALRDKQTTLFNAGQQVEVTGIMKQIKGQPVFLARTVKADNQLYSVRNEHGFPVSPLPRERASHKSADQSTNKKGAL